MRKVPDNWLATKADKLVDMNDLLLVQRLIQLQNETHWFGLSDEVMSEVYQAHPNHYKRRKKRLVRDGVMEYRLYKHSDGCHEPLYRLAGIYE